MTVIHADFGDTDTKVLTKLWEGIPADVHTVKRGSLGSFWDMNKRDELKQDIFEEENTILFCGHGTHLGLWEPGAMYLLRQEDAKYLNAKNIIGIWCYARVFAIETGLRGFYSSMFISNSREAAGVGIYNVSDKEITASEVRFCERVNKLLKDNTPLNQWLDILRSYPITNAVEEFNYSGLFYQD